MYWWHIAAEAVRAGQAKRFGFITTNSIKQTFNRRVLQAQLEAKNPLSLAFAIPDHPWVDAADGAAVRIAMTVGAVETTAGCLVTVVRETSSEQENDAVETFISQAQGEIAADLSVGAKVSQARPLQALAGVCFQGVKLVGDGFRLSREERDALLEQGASGDVIREYWTGSDLTKVRQPEWVVDFYGLEQAEAAAQHPLLYQRLLTEVKPFRDQVKRKGHRERWWLFGEARPGMRAALSGLRQFIATSEVAKHRLFMCLDAEIALADGSLMAVALDDAFFFGLLSSRIHALWAFAAGGTLEDRARYTKNLCFETFPFPDAMPEQQAKIRSLAEQLDAHRKRQQAQYPELTLTGMYNVLEKLRADEELNAKEKIVHAQGLVSLLRELHDELDRAVFAAYGWDNLAEQLVGLPGATTPLADKPEEQAEAENELLRRLVELNAQRAAEEARGLIRWLRPDYQNPNAESAPEQAEAELETEDVSAKPAAKAKKLAWPKGMREQIATLRSTLGSEAMSLEELSSRFTAPKTTTPLIVDALAALEELGMLYQEDEQYRLAG